MREPNVVVGGPSAAPTRPSPESPTARGLGIASARIATITHGQASDPF